MHQKKDWQRVFFQQICTFLKSQRCLDAGQGFELEDQPTNLLQKTVAFPAKSNLLRLIQVIFWKCSYAHTVV